MPRIFTASSIIVVLQVAGLLNWSADAAFAQFKGVKAKEDFSAIDPPELQFSDARGIDVGSSGNPGRSSSQVNEINNSRFCWPHPCVSSHPCAQ